MNSCIEALNARGKAITATTYRQRPGAKSHLSRSPKAARAVIRLQIYKILVASVDGPARCGALQMLGGYLWKGGGR